MENLELYKKTLLKIEQIDKELAKIDAKVDDIFEEMRTIDLKDLTKEKRIYYYKKIDEIMEQKHTLVEKRYEIFKKAEELYYTPIEVIKGSKVDLVIFLGDSKPYNYAICLHKTKQPVGAIDYRKNKDEPISKGWTAEIGYHIDERYQGRGYAKEALNLLTDKLHSDGIESVYIATNNTNKASKQIIEKFGGKLEKEFSDQHYLLYKCNLKQIKKNRGKKLQ